MIKQIEWEVENGPITKNGLLALTTFFFFFKVNLSIRTSYKKLV